jgi:DNA-directed RNA polymerase subunit M/transcription elongation factor TFIIS
MDRKTIGTKVLSTIMTKPKNVQIFLKYIDKLSKTDEDFVKNLYQISGDVISKELPLTELIKEVKNRNIGWKHRIYNDIKSKLDEHDDFIINPFEIIESVIECRKCGSKKTFSYSKQCRSSDESATLFVTCAVCHNKWSQSA